MNNPAAVEWSGIDTVLLDMDGTLLDLRFDTWFWQDLVPCRYAAANGLSLEETRELLAPRFTEVRGTLDWYCIEYWSRILKLDIAGMKREAREAVGFLPGAKEFLRKLQRTRKRCLLVTNAHPRTLAIKNEQVALTQYFHVCHSTHTFEYPKEHGEFWPRLAALERFDARRTILVDDSLSVLDAARDFGIGWLRAVRCPDSGRPPQPTADYAAVDRVAELM